MKEFIFALLTLLLFTDYGFSQIVPSDIESSTHLFRGGVSDKDGKNKSYNRSFTTSDGFIMVESGGSVSSSGSFNNLDSHNLNITSSKKIEELTVKRRISKSWSKDVVNTILTGNVTNNLKLGFSTKGRVILRGNSKASLNLKLQLGNRHSGFILATAVYEFRLKNGDPSKIEIYNKHNIIETTIPNGGEFEFSYRDKSHRTFIGEKEAVFTTSTLVETSPVSEIESYALLRTDSGYDLTK